jgi:hypothetical protein
MRHKWGRRGNSYRLLVGKPEKKTPLERPRHRWIDNIKMDLLEIGVSVVDWIGLPQNRCRTRVLASWFVIVIPQSICVKSCKATCETWPTVSEASREHCHTARVEAR